MIDRRCWVLESVGFNGYLGNKHGHGAACDVERTRLTIVHFSALLPSIRLYFNVYSHEDRMTWSAEGSVGTNSVYWKESQVEILKVDSYEVVEFCRNS